VTVYGSDPNNSNATQWLPGTAIYHYDANGNLTQVNDGDGTASYNRIVSYQTNLLGQVLNRSETNYGVAGAQRRFFYLNGEAVGDVGTDALPSDIDYAQQLAPLTTTQMPRLLPAGKCRLQSGRDRCQRSRGGG